MKRDSETNLTFDEKMMLHLLKYVKYKEDFKVPLSVTQQGIADELGIYQGNVPRTIARLLEQGFVTCIKRHVTGVKRRRISYFLTPTGVTQAKKIMESLPDIEHKRFDASVASTQRQKVYLPDANKSSLSPESPGIQKVRFVNYIDDSPKLLRFIGRATELKTLVNWIENDGRIIAISGIAGVGKTTLAAQLVNRFQGKKCMFWMRFFEWINVPNILIELGEFLSKLGRKRLATYMETKQTPDIWEVANILRNDFAGFPVLIVFDDVHRASDSLRPFFSMLIALAEKTAGFTIVFLTREPLRFYDARHTDVRKSVIELHLEGLDRQSSDEFLAIKGVDRLEFEAIYKFTKGHPLALELIHSCEDLKMRTGSIYGFIRNEIFLGLSEPEKLVLKSAGVHRYPVSISAMLGGDRPDAETPGVGIETINSLFDRGLLIQTSQDTYNVHDLIREYVYADLTPPQRMKYHMQAAGYYNEMSSPDPTTENAFVMESMYHYLKAGEYRKVAGFVTRFQNEPLDAGLTEQLKNILEEVNEGDIGEGWEDVLILKGNLYEKTGKWDQALKCYESCVKRINNSSRPEKLGILYERLGKIYLNKNKWKESLGYYRKSISIMESHDNALGVALAERGAGTVLQKTGRYKDALPYQRHAMEVGKKLGDPGLIAGSLSDIARIHVQLGNYSSSIVNFRKCIRVSQEHSLQYELGRAYYNLSQIHHFRGEIDAALDNCIKSERIHLKMGFIRETMWLFYNMGELYARKKDFGKAELYISRGADIARELHDEMGIAMSHIQSGIICRLRGDYSKAGESLCIGINLAKKLGMPTFLADAYFEYGINFLRMNDRKRASDCFNSARKILVKIGAGKHYTRRMSIAMEK